ncbi:hypothetical protein GQ53DRAFT_743239 [Thozetella sp. PMI_491]|nr:hypothetical protein GQ53DRAFT_743239 [Thozetella sp. PMI_491]
MGNCSSCFGQRHRDTYDEEDEAQRLFDDPSGMHYGSFDQQHLNGQEDPQEVQREIEALQQVVARTSNNLVDIYEIDPQDKTLQSSAAHPYAHVGQEARMARYQTLLTKLSSRDDFSSVARVDWGTPEDDPIEMQRSSPAAVKLEGSGGALVGNFADAVAAMR